MGKFLRRNNVGALATTALLLTATTAKAQTNGTGGTVELIYNGGGWIAPVQIGGQTVYLNIDTGSSDLWTASTELPADVQQTITRGQVYNPDQSTTYQEVPGETYDLEYGDGSGSSGGLGTDVIQVGTAIVPKMPFGVCNTLKYGSGETSRDTEGPIGLAFRALNSVRPDPQCTFMECLDPYVQDPLFCTRFRADNTSTIDFGFIDTSKYTGDVTEIGIDDISDENDGQWGASNVQVGVNGQALSSTTQDMIFDTGGAGMTLDPSIVSAYWALVPGSDASSNSYPCGATLPDLTFTFANITNGGPADVTIPGDALKNGDGTGMCGSWLGSATGRGNGGTPFYVSKYMIWNHQKPSLSFANQA